MAKTTKTTASLNAAGTAKTSAKIAEVSINALPLPQVMQPIGQAAPAKVSKAVNQRLIEEEELLQDKIVVEELPQALETNAMGDVLMAQASVPAAGTTGTAGAAGAAGGAAATTAAVAVPAATATGFAGMSGLGLLGAAAGVVGVAAVASSGGGSSAAALTFSVTETIIDGVSVVEFDGTAGGDITVAIGATDVATFMRGGITATTSVATLSNNTITVEAGQTLVMTGVQMELPSVQGVTVNGAGNFTIDANDAGLGDITSRSFVLKVALTGGNLKFDMTDDNQDKITLTAGSSISLGGGNLIVSDGEVNLVDVTLSGIGNITINSKAILSYAQLDAITGQVFTGADETPGELEIVLTSAGEAELLIGLLAELFPAAVKPDVTFAVKNDNPVVDAAIRAELAVQTAAIELATGTTVVTALTLVQALAATATNSLPTTYVINDTDLDLGSLTVAAAVDIRASIATILVGAKEPAPAISDVVLYFVTDSITNLAGAATVVLNQANGITLTNTATTAADLNALDGKTSAPINAESVTTLSGTAAEIATALSSNGIATSDNANLTVSDAGGSVLTATALSDLGVKTTGTVTVSDAVVITGTTAEITAALVTDATRVFANLATVTFTDIPTQDELAAIKGVHAGTIIFKTLTLIEAFDLVDSDAALPAAKTYNIDFGDPNGVLEFGTFTAEEISISDQRFGSLKVNAVNLINERDIKNAIFTIEDTAANLLAADIFQSIDGAREIIVIDEAGVILAASDLTLLANIQNAGPVTVTNAVVITGTTAQLLAALVTPETRVFAGKATVTFIDTPNDNDRLAIENAISGTDSLKTFTLIEALALVNSGADLPAAKTYNIEKGVVELGTVTVEELMGIDARFGLLEAGAVNTINEGDSDATFTIGDTATNLLRVIGQDVIDGATSIIVIDAAGTVLAAADLTRLANIQNTGPVTVSNAVVITGSIDALTTALVPALSTGGALEARVSAINATVIVNGVAEVGVTQSNAISLIAGATSGVITVNGTANADTLDFSGYTLDGSVLTINGLSGENVITGSIGNDIITGGLGNDIINGGSGADRLTGGGGQDTFTLALGGTGTVITDFTAGPRMNRIDTEDGTKNVDISAIEGADFFNYTSDLKSIDGSVKGNGIYQSSIANDGLLLNTIIFELEDATTDGTKAGLITALGATATTNGIETDDSLLFINYLTGQDSGAQVWSFIDANGGNIEASELTLLATLTNVQAYTLDFTNFIA